MNKKSLSCERDFLFVVGATRQDCRIHHFYQAGYPTGGKKTNLLEEL